MKVIEPENGGCEIKEFEKTERNFVLIIDYTSIKKMKFFKVTSAVENELPLFHMVNVNRIVYNMGALKTGSKDNKILEFK